VTDDIDKGDEESDSEEGEEGAKIGHRPQKDEPNDESGDQEHGPAVGIYKAKVSERRE
jgi:hypothetical protein